MKKLLIIATVLMVAVTTHAQNGVGEITVAPTFGLNWASITKLSQTKNKIGIAIGANAEYGFTDNIGLSAGMLFSQQGTKFKRSGKMRLDYLTFPILANYYVMDGLAIKAGIQPSILIDASDRDNHNCMKGCNKFDLAIPVGASYEYQNVVFDIRYNIGLLKVYKKEITNKNCHNSVFQITAGYKFKL